MPPPREANNNTNTDRGLCVVIALVATALFFVIFLGTFFGGWFKTIKEKQQTVQTSCVIKSVSEQQSYCCSRQCTNCVFQSSLPDCDDRINAYQSTKPSLCVTPSPSSQLCPPSYPAQSPCRTGSGLYASTGREQFCAAKRLCSITCPVCFMLLVGVSFQNRDGVVTLDANNDLFKKEQWLLEYQVGTETSCYYNKENYSDVRFFFVTPSWQIPVALVFASLTAVCFVWLVVSLFRLWCGRRER